jgi:cell division septation protein DedD
MTVMERPPASIDPEPAARPAAAMASLRGVLNKAWFWGVLGIVGLLAIGAVVAWLGGDDDARDAGPAPAPLIKADPEPVKLRPEEPGGMEVPNRDKLVYRRLEGLAEPPTVEKLLPEPEEPLPPPTAKPKPIPEPESPPVVAAETASSSGMAATTAEPPAAPDERKMPAAAPPPADHPPSPVKATEPASVYQVQLVAVRKREQAEGMWDKLGRKYPDVFAKLEPEIVRADLGNKGVLYRLRAGPLDSEAAARSLCADLKRRKVDCLVVRHGG